MVSLARVRVVVSIGDFSGDVFSTAIPPARILVNKVY